MSKKKLFDFQLFLKINILCLVVSILLTHINLPIDEILPLLLSYSINELLFYFLPVFVSTFMFSLLVIIGLKLWRK